jgi:hypothetical protein
MPNNPQSKVDGVSLEAVVFIDAFCRRNLSLEEIMLISDIFNAALYADFSPMEKRKLIMEYMRQSPQMVTLSAQRNSSEPSTPPSSKLSRKR